MIAFTITIGRPVGLGLSHRQQRVGQGPLLVGDAGDDHHSGPACRLRGGAALPQSPEAEGCLTERWPVAAGPVGRKQKGRLWRPFSFTSCSGHAGQSIG